MVRQFPASGSSHAHEIRTTMMINHTFGLSGCSDICFEAGGRLSPLSRLSVPLVNVPSGVDVDQFAFAGEFGKASTRCG